jgi:hypothetical protein
LLSYLLRRKMADARIPEPRSRAAAGNIIEALPNPGPPLLGSGWVLSMVRSIFVVVPPVVCCAMTVGARISKATRAAVAK